MNLDEKILNKFLTLKPIRTYRFELFAQVMELRYYHILVPIFFSFVLAALAGIGVGLIVPLAEGIVKNDFSVLKNTKFLGSAIDKIYPTLYSLESFQVLTILVGVILSASILKAFLSYVTKVLAVYWDGYFLMNLKVFIFSRYLTFGKQYFDHYNQGQMGSVVNMGGALLEVNNHFQGGLRQVLELSAYMVIMFFIDYRLTLFSLLLFPILHFSLKTIIKKVREAANKSVEQHLELTKKLHNVLSCVPLVKAYCREPEAIAIYKSTANGIRKLAVDTSRIQHLAMPIQETIILLTLMGLTLSAVNKAGAGGNFSSLADFFVFLYIARKVFPMFQVFNTTKMSLAKALPRVKILSRLIERNDKFIVEEGKLSFTGLKSEIKLNNLSFSYIPEKETLHQLNASFNKGEVTAVVGRTGSGKTTLINLLLRFYECPKNSILIDGTDIRNFSFKSLRKRIALVSQDSYLLNSTLKENLLYGASENFSEEDLTQVLHDSQLYEFVSSLPDGLETIVGDRGIRLSNGERQRVSIARALIKKAEILILDEATSSLDSKTEIKVQKAIDNVVSNRTTIVIAHRLSTIKAADKIIVLEDGMITEQGKIEDLFEKEGNFYSYWESQKLYTHRSGTLAN